MFTLRGGLFPRLVAIFPLIFPLYLLRGEPFGIPVTFPEVVLGFMLLYFLYRECRDLRLREFKVWPVLLFLLAGLIGVLVAPQASHFVDGQEFLAKTRALGIFKGWIFLPITYFFIARYYFKEKPSLIDLALKSLTLGGVLLSLYAIYQVISGNYPTLDMRASGPFESANYLALYLGPIVVYTVLNFFQKKDKWERIFSIIVAVICFAALYFTKSYAAWISIFAALFVGFFIFLKSQKPKVQIVSAVLISFLFAALFFSQIKSEKFEQFIDFENRSSSTVRLEVYEIALTLIKENPILGIGLGQFEQVYQVSAERILEKQPFEWVMIHPHNIFLAFWLNIGILGLIAFVWLLYLALPWLFEKNSKGRSIAAVMLLTIVIHGFFDVPYFKNDLAFQLWLILAMLI